jgi:hypothetical protein
VNHIERRTEIPFSRTGRFATLGALRRRGGSGAPSVRRVRGLAALGVAFCLVLLLPSGASAHFVRPFLRQTTGTCEKAEESPPSCPGSKFVPFGEPGEIAVDGEGNQWILEGEGQSLDEFGPSGAYRQTLDLEGHGGQYPAIGPTGTLYVASRYQVSIFGKTGGFEGSIPMKGAGAEADGIAVDDSTDPLDSSAGDLYVFGGRELELPAGSFEARTLRKFNAAGEEEDWQGFKGSEACRCHVSGDEIVFEESLSGITGEGAAVAVDPVNGDIWVSVYKSLLEFSSAGEVIREITYEEVPRFEGYSALSEVDGLAVDPTDGNLLVSLTTQFNESSGERTVGAVDELDSEGVFLGQVTEAAGLPLSGAYGLAMDSHGDLYVVNHAPKNRQGVVGGVTHAVDEFEVGHFVPGLRPAAATQRERSSAVLNGFVDPESDLNPEREGITDCRFEYVTEAAFRKSSFEDLSSGGEVPCEHPDAGEIPKSDAETSVHASVGEHVVSGVTYRYRLAATIGGALGGSGYSAVAAFTAPHAPEVGATAAEDVTSTFARLSADVDPLGADTVYQFQYLSEEQFEADGESFAGAAVVPAAPVDVGSGGEAGDLSEAVGEQVGGLSPDTTYRFRLIASNEAGVSEGEGGEGGREVAHTFTTQPAVTVGLPEDRAYELLTPPDKEGSEDLFKENEISHISEDHGLSSESGDQFLLSTNAAFGSFPAAGGNIYLFSRHPAAGHPEHAEWTYTSLVSPALGLQSLTHAAAVEPADFSMVAFQDRVGAPASEGGFAETSLLGVPGGPYTTLHADQASHDVGADPTREATEIVGASRDLGVAVLKSTNPALAQGGVCEHDFCSAHELPNLYEWAGGQLSPLNVRSDGEPISACGAALGSGSVAEDEEADNDVSADGSKIFFTAPIPPSETAYKGLDGAKGCPTKNGENPAELYMHSGEETIEVSAPEEGAPEQRAGHEAVFFGAAEDGSRVFFTSEGELTKNDAGIHDIELYEYDTETGRLTRISAGDSGDALGDLIPFGERLIGIGTALIKDVVVSSDGLHVYFVARGVLAPANAEGRSPVEGEANLYVYDTQTGRTSFIARGPGSGPVQGERDFEYAAPEATADGRYLLFQGAMLSHSDSQLYRYDADTEGLVCVSCTPTYPAGVSLLFPSVMGYTNTGKDVFPAHAISEGGSVFFNTDASLVPQDTNGALDVYEWHEGVISLISSGQDPSGSYFLGASPNGANVFFGSHARLVPADTSGGGNLYDARVCEPERGNPCIAVAPAKEGLCEGDACSHPATAPSDATPASATFAGPGDLTPAPSTTPKAKTCVRPKKLSDGRCVKPKPRRRKPKPKPKSKKSGSERAASRRATRSDKEGRR